jgi:hypothetical protein
LQTKIRHYALAFGIFRGMLVRIETQKKRRKKMPDFNRIAKMMSEQWPWVFVLRLDAKKATGNVFTPDHVKNMELRGEGPNGKFRIGKKVAYPRDEFYAWFAEKMS